MEWFIDMIVVDGNILATFVNFFGFAFILDFILSFGSLLLHIGDSALNG